MIVGRPLDGHVNRVLEGKTIETATKDGRLLWLQMTNGERFALAWANPETGEGAPGEPCLVKVDVAVSVSGVVLGSEVGVV